MSKRKVQLFSVFSLRRSNLADMLESIEKVKRHTAGVDFERFANSDLLVDAVVPNLAQPGDHWRSSPAHPRNGTQALSGSPLETGSCILRQREVQSPSDG